MRSYPREVLNNADEKNNTAFSQLKTALFCRASVFKTEERFFISIG